MQDNKLPIPNSLNIIWKPFGIILIPYFFCFFILKRSNHYLIVTYHVNNVNGYYSEPECHITVPVFTTFDAKEQQRPDNKQTVIILCCPELSAKYPEGQATEGSAA